MPHRLKLIGHVALETAEREFTRLSQKFPVGARVDVLIDMTGVTGYDEAARSWFTAAWTPVWAACLRRVAVVEQPASWCMVTAAMATSTRMQLRAFATLAEAEKWLAEP